jgi:hypothetical protein
VRTFWRERIWTTGILKILLHSIRQFFKFLPGEQQQAFLAQAHQKAS